MNPNFNLSPEELLAQKDKKIVSPFEGEHVQALRTFEEDIAEAVRDGKGSVLGIALAEQKRKDDQISYIAETKSSSWLIVVGVVFFMAAVGLLGFVGYSAYSDKQSVLKKLQENGGGHNEIISSEKNTNVDISKLFPKNNAYQSLAYFSAGTSLSTRALEIITPVTLATSSKVFVAASPKIIWKYIAPHSPALLTRSLGDNIVLGLYSGDVATPFIVLKINSYEGAFGGMLEWERFISDDLFALFSVTLPRNTGAVAEGAAEISQAGSSTGGTTEAPTQEQRNLRDIGLFVDRTIKNRDMRVIQDDTGKIYMLYGFANKETLILTTSPEAFFEISGRLRQ